MQLLIISENRCPESLVVHGVAKSHVIADVGVQTDGGADQQPVGLKEYILSHREEVKTIILQCMLLFLQVFGLLALSPRPSSLSSPGQHCATSPLALDKPLRRCRSERRSQSLGEREAVLSRSLTGRRGFFARSRNPGTQDAPALRSPLQRFQAKFGRAASLEVPDVAAEPTKFTIPEIKLDVPEEESPQLHESRLY